MKHLLFVTLVLAAGCGKSSSPPEQSTDSTAGPATAATPTTAAPAPAADKAGFEARRMFSTVCATCHGPTGRGDGQAAAGLNPKPRNYTDRDWQASVTDDELAKVIVFGGAAVGKSAVMPGTPQLKQQPEVLAELVKIVRKFGE